MQTGRGRKLRRFAHLSRDALELLEQVEGDDWRRTYENLLQAERHNDRKHRRHTADVDVDLEVLAARAEHGDGAGGGRRRGPRR